MSDDSEDRRPERKKRKTVRPSYEDAASESDLEEELVTETLFDLNDKIFNPKFGDSAVKIVQGKELTLSYFQRHGFSTPMLCHDKAGLGIRVPPPTFTVSDVRNCVGGKRMLDVMTVADQSSLAMSMEDWHNYYDSKHKKQLLNVISLEFSLTKLDKMVAAPIFVRNIDWVNLAWPAELRARQADPTNNMTQMMYPKVQKYCLMSVKGCYTDFHVDFGGTSVWYHIIRGGKVFWLIPPTDSNLKLYEEWTLSGRQSSIFFGDLAGECSRINLKAGDTFFIPAGWIHAVFTPEDSLVFGGNFLHSFAIERQIKVAQIEDTTKVPQKFRYPFYSEMLWYVLARYVEALLGVQHLDLNEVKDETIEDSKPVMTAPIHLTPFELSGIKAIVMYLHALPANRKNIPDLVKDPVALIRDVRSIVEQHRNDKVQLSVTGVYVLSMAASNKNANLSFSVPEIVTSAPTGTTPESFTRLKKRGRKPKNRYLCEDYESSGAAVPSPKKGPKNLSAAMESNAPRRRRTRCRDCAACLRDDCGECVFCNDMVKFGGAGKAKQTCKARQCLRPLLPLTAVCIFCRLDGWLNKITVPVAKPPKDVLNSLMECSCCYEIVHPKCVEGEYDSERGVVNGEMPSSWICPKCVFLGKDQDSKPRHFKAREVYLKLKSEDPSTSGEPRLSRETVTPIKREFTSPDTAERRRANDEPPTLSLISPLSENKTGRNTPAELRPASGLEEEKAGILEPGKKLALVKKRPSEDFETAREHAKKMMIFETPEAVRKIESRAESRNENEERMYAAIQKTRECTNYQTLKELALATGRTIKLPIVVVRHPLTEQQVENLDRMEEEKEKQQIATAKREAEEAAKAEAKQEVKEEEIEPEQCETPQRMTRLKAEKVRESESRASRRKTIKPESITPEKSGIKTRKSRAEEEKVPEVETKRKTRASIESPRNEDETGIRTRGRLETRSDKAKAKTPSTETRRSGRTEVEKPSPVEIDSSLRRGRSSIPTPSSTGRIGSRSRTETPAAKSQKKTPEKPRALVVEIEKIKLKRSCSKSEKGEKWENKTPEKAVVVEILKGKISPGGKGRYLRSNSALEHLKDQEKDGEGNESIKGEEENVIKVKEVKQEADELENETKNKAQKKGVDSKKTGKSGLSRSSSNSSENDKKCIDKEPRKENVGGSTLKEIESSVIKETVDCNPEPELKVVETSNVLEIEASSKIGQDETEDLLPPILEKQITVANLISDLNEKDENIDSSSEATKVEPANEKPGPVVISTDPVEVKEEHVIEPTNENAETALVPFLEAALRDDVAVSTNVEVSKVLTEANVLKKIFKYLGPADLSRCCLVCREWSKVGSDPTINRRIALHCAVASPGMLRFIVRRQPSALDLSWTDMNHSQLRWTLVRLPKLAELRLAGMNVSVAFALTEYLCPSLEYLDLGFLSGLTDGFLRDILVPKNQVQRPPGATNRKPRLQGLQKLRLSSCGITDAGLLILSENLKALTRVDLSQCWRITPLGLSQFFESPNNKNLEAISLAGCPQVTDDLICQILAMENLRCLDIRYIRNISKDDVVGYQKILGGSGKKFEIENGGILKAAGFDADW